jgi:hypothetical protein
VPQPVEVVVAADVLVAALSRLSPAAVMFPAMPPKTVDPHTDVIGAVVGSEGDFALILSEEILAQTVTVLTDPGGLGWAFDAVEEAVDVLCGIAGASSGGLVTEEHRVQWPKAGTAVAAAFRAVASDALGFPRVVVTNDADALALRTWMPHGVPWPAEEAVSILSPTRFRDLVEQARWRYRKLPLGCT